jgi:hypothetical protein
MSRITQLRFVLPTLRPRQVRGHSRRTSSIAFSRRPTRNRSHSLSSYRTDQFVGFDALPPERLAFSLDRAAAAVQSTGQSPAPTAAPSRISQSEALEEVTVTARRSAELAPKVRAFVNEISVVDAQAEGLARWHTRVCPLVSGLPRGDGEFILERLSEVARLAKVPLAGEQCRPNLYILVSAQPEDLLRAMEKRNRTFTFGHDPFRGTDTPARIVDEFIKTPRPVRVWYNSSPEGADYATPGLGFPSNVADMNGGGGLAMPTISEWERSSHVASTLVRTFSTVFVVVNLRQLQGVTRGQLADYVGMVGFAQIKPTARLNDARTILKLFDGTPQAAPPGLTDWDQAFVRSLYATEQGSKVQRALIAKDMVREIVH